MGGLPSIKLQSLLYFSLVFLFTALGFLILNTIAADFTSLIFKGCANQKFQDPSAIYTQNLKSVMESLVSQSSQKSYSSVTSGDSETGITGVYQCRGDLSTSQCSTCISKIPDMADKLCGKVIAARVQLSGCYLKYHVVGFNDSSGTELLYKVCGSSKAATGFEATRTAAFDMMVNGVKNGNGFYTGNYQTLYVLAQCQGDLSSGDCEDCVKSAVTDVKTECGNSISGQAHLNKCYISYNYYANGVPTISSAPGDETEHHTQRTVAIAVGGVAALGFLIVCLLFVKSLVKRRHSKHEGWN